MPEELDRAGLAAAIDADLQRYREEFVAPMTLTPSAARDSLDGRIAAATVPVLAGAWVAGASALLLNRPGWIVANFGSWAVPGTILFIFAASLLGIGIAVLVWRNTPR